MVIYLGYSSSLMSSLIVAPLPKTIDTWEELVESDYKLIMNNNSAFPTYFRVSGYIIIYNGILLIY
jgi:ABC-type sulfate transport system substrate-binding protein